jgi:hypothetical protein
MVCEPDKADIYGEQTLKRFHIVGVPRSDVIVCNRFGPGTLSGNAGDAAEKRNKNEKR